MKFFFISDIHGNQFALKSILEYAKEINSDLIFCAGDLSGYFTGINEVISLLKAYKVQAILGNHDAFLLNLIKIDSDERYYSAFTKTKSELSLDSYNWLKTLPKTLDFLIGNTQLKIYHGGPSNLLNQYVYPDTIDFLNFKQNRPTFFVFGHTHLQFVFKHDDCIFINPGSVGLPRNGDFRAHGISYNSDLDIFSEHRVSYNLNELIDHFDSEVAIDQRFIHNVTFGRSSKKVLKKRHSFFLDNDIVNILERKGIIIINTKYGAILSSQGRSTIENLLYIASYGDHTVELTSNTLYFNWQNKLNIEMSKILENESFIRDNAGFYYHEIFSDKIDFKSNIINRIEIAFNLINKINYTNVTI